MTTYQSGKKALASSRADLKTRLQASRRQSRKCTTSPESYKRRKRKRRSSDSTSTDSFSSSYGPDKTRKKRRRPRSPGRGSTGREDIGILKDTLVTLTTKLKDLTKNITSPQLSRQIGLMRRSNG